MYTRPDLDGATARVVVSRIDTRGQHRAAVTRCGHPVPNRGCTNAPLTQFDPETPPLIRTLATPRSQLAREDLCNSGAPF